MVEAEEVSEIAGKTENVSPWRLCIAPMMDWTDRHCRYFLRLITPRARLYTEMVTTGAMMFGNVPRHLDFDPAEHPIALQLGGSDPHALAHCARLGEAWGEQSGVRVAVQANLDSARLHAELGGTPHEDVRRAIALDRARHASVRMRAGRRGRFRRVIRGAVPRGALTVVPLTAARCAW